MADEYISGQARLESTIDRIVREHGTCVADVRAAADEIRKVMRVGGAVAVDQVDDAVAEVMSMMCFRPTPEVPVKALAEQMAGLADVHIPTAFISCTCGYGPCSHRG